VFRDHLPRLTLLRALSLALMLLLAQGLGLSHGVAHAQRAPATDSPAPAAAGEPAWDQSHQAGDVECRLIDQLGHVDAVVAGLPPALPAPCAEQSLAAGHCAARQASCAAGYLARGPPG
jgi:hypothetical protein